MKHARSLSLAIGLCLGCGGGDSSGDPPSDPNDAVAETIGATDSSDAIADADDAVVDGPVAPLKSITLAESPGDVLNPERGIYRGVMFTGSTHSFAADRKPEPPYSPTGRTLVLLSVQLAPYRASAIPDSFLTGLDAELAAVRAARLKVVIRFVYNDPTGAECSSGSVNAADASKARILAHLDQLASHLSANADVIFTMQAGFIGCWGEWHSSTNLLSDDKTPDDHATRKEIVEKMLAALPSSRMIQLRTPRFKLEATGGPTADVDAFSTTAKAARVGHFNDCFLASADDYGTYSTTTLKYLTGSVADWKSFVALDTRTSPSGGETCPPVAGNRQACKDAVPDMAMLHWTFLHQGWYQKTLDGFIAGGCYDEIVRRLGYRLSIADAEYSSAVAPGGVLRVKLTLKNTGFASLYNPRPVYVVLHDGAKRWSALLGKVDPRRWSAGASSSIDVRLRVPASVAVGKAKLGLALPDESIGPGGSKSLADVAEYSVRLVNDGVWDGAGNNWFASDLSIDPSAPGPIDVAATSFSEL